MIFLSACSNDYSWNECPSGYYYQGFGYSEMLCCKPSSHPRSYSVCYTLSITDQNKAAQCSQDYFITGSQDRPSGNAIDTKTLRCCKMYNSKSPPHKQPLIPDSAGFPNQRPPSIVDLWAKGSVRP